MKAILSLGLCLVLAGCSPLSQLPTAHQIEHMVLFETLGVDGDGGEMTLTALSQGRASAGDTPGQSGLVLNQDGQTLAAAQAQMQTQGSDYLFFGQVEQFLVGSELAETGLGDFLDYVATDPTLRLESALWVVEGSAQSVLDPEGDVTNRLTALADDGSRLGRLVSRSARTVLVESKETGFALVPGVKPGVDGTLEPLGYGLLAEDKLVGWATGLEAQGFTLLLGGGAGDTVEVTGSDGALTALLIEQIKVDTGLEGNRLTVDCKTQARILQGAGRDLERLSWALEDTLEEFLQAAIQRSQRDNRDYANLLEQSLAPQGLTLQDIRVEVTVQGTVLPW